MMTKRLFAGRTIKRFVAVVGAGVLATGLVGGPANSQSDDFVTGSGQSYAQIYRVGPTAGRLSLAPIFGLSLSDYLNTVGRGEAKAADWAGIGVASRELPDRTPAVKVASTDKESEKGEVFVAGKSDGEQGGGFFELLARASDAPSGESRARIASLSIPGLLEARDTQAHTTAGVINTRKGKARRSTSSTNIGVLDIAGRTVTLKGLRWQAVQLTGAVESVTGKFTVEGVAIGGTRLPMPGGPSDLAAVIDPINAALAPTGFAISVPAFEKRSGQAEVTPLSLDIVNSPLGRQFLAPILAQTLTTRNRVTDPFIALAKKLNEDSDGRIPDLTVAVLASDLTLGIASGSSQLHLEFGGVRAFTEGQAYENPFTNINFDPPPVSAGEPPKTVFSPGTPGQPGVPGSAPSDEGELVAAAPGQRTIPGDKGGVAVAVGLIGLAVAIGLAAADWYRMRMSRRAAVTG